MKIYWKSKGRTKEYADLSIPVPADLEIDKQWTGHGSYSLAWIDNGRLHVKVKRDIPKEKPNEQK